jgi:hypothetical protein
LRALETAADQYAQTIAAASQIETLHCADNQLLEVAEGWWRRCGSPPLQHAGFIDDCEWMKHQLQRVDAAKKESKQEKSDDGDAGAMETGGDADAEPPPSQPPMIRALHCGPAYSPPSPDLCAFPYCAAQLR